MIRIYLNDQLFRYRLGQVDFSDSVNLCRVSLTDLVDSNYFFNSMYTFHENFQYNQTGSISFDFGGASS